MINLKAAIVGFASILFLVWLAYVKIKDRKSRKDGIKNRKKKSKMKKLRHK